MRDNAHVRTHKFQGYITVVLMVLLIGAVPLLACAISRTPARTSSTLTIVNNSNLQFRHAYFSPVDGDNWGPDQLNGSTIAPGDSRNLNVACSSSSVKAIIEDQNGCFLYQVVSCADNSTWTVTTSAAPDCGS